MSLIESTELEAEIERILAERRKRMPRVTFTLRVPRATWPLVQEAARAEGVSLQEWVQRAIGERLTGTGQPSSRGDDSARARGGA